MNSRHRLIILVLSLAVLLGASSVKAQESISVPTRIEAIDQAYRALEYERAERMAREMLSEYQMLTVEQLTELHRLLAIILISQNSATGARRHFEAALSLDPDLRLDPTFVSPKIIDFYEKVRKDYLTDAGRPAADSLAVRYRLIQDPRPGAALRSAIFPGWGQVYLGQPRRGHLLMGAWSLSIGGAVAAYGASRRALRPKKWKRLRTGLLIAAAGIWIGSYLDALLTSPDYEGKRFRIGLRPTPNARAELAVQFRF